MSKVFVGDFYTSKFGYSLKLTEKNIEKVREKLTEALDALEVGGYLNINEIAQERREETATRFGKDIEQTASHVLVVSPASGGVGAPKAAPKAAARPTGPAKVQRF